MSDSRDTTNNTATRSGELSREIIADTKWKKTSAKLRSDVVSAIVVACLIFVGLNPFYRPTTDEMAAEENRSHILSDIDDFVFHWVGRPGEQPLVSPNTESEWFPELTEFDRIVASVPFIAKDVQSIFDVSHLNNKSCPGNPFDHSPGQYYQVVDAAKKLNDIDRQLRDTGLAAKKKEDLSIDAMIVVLSMFRGAVGQPIRQLMNVRVNPLSGGTDWVCSNLWAVMNLGKQLQTYDKIIAENQGVKVADWPSSQTQVIEQERVRLYRDVHIIDPVIAALASKTLTGFYEGMVHERDKTQADAEAYAGGKGPIKDLLPPLPFFWLVAVYPLVCCWAYLRMVIRVRGMTAYLVKPGAILKDSAQGDLQNYCGLPEIRNGRTIIAHAVAGACFGLLPILVAVALKINCLDWSSDPIIAERRLHSYIEAAVPYYNYAALYLTWQATFLCAVGIYLMFLAQRQRLLLAARGSDGAQRDRSLLAPLLGVLQKLRRN